MTALLGRYLQCSLCKNSKKEKNLIYPWHRGLEPKTFQTPSWSDFRWSTSFICFSTGLAVTRDPHATWTGNVQRVPYWMNDKVLNVKLGSEMQEDTSFTGPTNSEFRNLGFAIRRWRWTIICLSLCLKFIPVRNLNLDIKVPLVRVFGSNQLGFKPRCDTFIIVLRYNDCHRRD